MGLINKSVGILYIIVTLFVVNKAFDFITLPGLILFLEPWIVLAGAVMIAIEGVRLFLKRSVI